MNLLKQSEKGQGNLWQLQNSACKFMARLKPQAKRWERLSVRFDDAKIDNGSLMQKNLVDQIISKVILLSGLIMP
jgi:hypothetical protein